VFMKEVMHMSVSEIIFGLDLNMSNDFKKRY